MTTEILWKKLKKTCKYRYVPEFKSCCSHPKIRPKPDEHDYCCAKTCPRGG